MAKKSISFGARGPHVPRTDERVGFEEADAPVGPSSLADEGPCAIALCSGGCELAEALGCRSAL